MLPPANRMRRSADFAAVVRSGRPVRRGCLVVHHLVATDGSTAPLVGFVVARAVGGSVVRHRVTRRLRAVTAARLPLLAPGVRLVIRALPPAATATSADLARDLDAALVRLGALTTAGAPA